jgi:hypothetical protein
VAARRQPEYDFYAGAPPLPTARAAASGGSQWVPLGPALAWTPPGRLPSGRRLAGAGRTAVAGPGRVRRRRFGGGLAVGAAAVAALGLGATAAAGVVRLLGPSGERDVWTATRVVTPDAVEGGPRMRSAQLDGAARLEQARVTQIRQQAIGAVALATQVAYYGSGGRRVVTVVAGRPSLPLSADQQDTVRQGFTATLGRAGVMLASRDAGGLGGWFGCGAVAAAGRGTASTTCVAVDGGAVVSVTVAGSGPPAQAHARRVRETVERRG